MHRFNAPRSRGPLAQSLLARGFLRKKWVRRPFGGISSQKESLSYLGKYKTEYWKEHEAVGNSKFSAGRARIENRKHISS
jgi:hypothetical protein